MPTCPDCGGQLHKVIARAYQCRECSAVVLRGEVIGRTVESPYYVHTGSPKDLG